MAATLIVASTIFRFDNSRASVLTIAGPLPPDGIERWPAPASPEAFAKFRRAGKAVVFTGLYPDVNGADPWTLDRLARRCGAHKFKARREKGLPPESDGLRSEIYVNASYS